MLLKIIVVFCLAFSAAAAEDTQSYTAQQWLTNMSHAMKTLNYQGTVIFMKNGQLDTMKYRHSVVDGIEQERLSSLNSPLREVTRISSEVSCLFKETAEKVVNHHPIDSSFILNFPSNSVDLENLYQISVVGKEAIAMLPTQIIAIQPKDELRYARKIWIDIAHFLPLKAEVYNADGAVLEQVLFTDLTVDSVFNSSFTDVDESKLHIKHIHATQAEPFENAGFMLRYWPLGFKTIFFIRNSMQQSQKAVDHLLISDGLSSVSIYLEPKAAKGMEGLHSLGSVNSYSRVLNDFQVTVLGEVPAKTVESIASGVALR